MNGESAYTGPFYIDVDISPFCNLNCRGCQYHSSKKREIAQGASHANHISLSLVDKICTALPELKTKEIFLCGQGEPLLHPEIGDIIAAFKRTRSKIHLFTNGTLINDTMAQLLLDSGLDVLRVSLWALNPEEYKKCCPGTDPVFLQKTLDGMRMVSKLKARAGRRHPKIILTAPLNRINYKNIETRIKLAHELGCDGLWFDIYQHWGEFTPEALSAEESSQLCKQLQKMKPVIKSFYMTHNINEFVNRYNMGEKAWQSMPCYAGWFHCRVQNNGQVLPCGSCRAALGDLNINSLTEIWNGPEYRAFRRAALQTFIKIPGRYACDCDWCCLGQSNFKVQRIFKWIHPLVKKRGSHQVGSA